jgi:chromate transporter
MIASAGFSLVILAFWNGKGISSNIENIDVIAVAIFLLAIIILRKWKVNPVAVMTGAGIMGLCLYAVFQR